MFDVHINTTDGWNEILHFETEEEAYEFVYKYLGNQYDVGINYAVNFYGDLTVYLGEFMTWNRYGEFAKSKKES